MPQFYLVRKRLEGNRISCGNVFTANTARELMARVLDELATPYPFEDGRFDVAVCFRGDYLGRQVAVFGQEDDPDHIDSECGRIFDEIMTAA